MEKILHITNGDCAGEILAKTGLPGDILVWNDLLYDGPRVSGWPTPKALEARAQFLEMLTGGGLQANDILAQLKLQYYRLQAAKNDETIILWFDACLCDQATMVHVLNCLYSHQIVNVQLICISEFENIVPFNGLGQLNPEQLKSHYSKRQVLTEPQFRLAIKTDNALAEKDLITLKIISQLPEPPLPLVPAAISRWIAENPTSAGQLGHLENLILQSLTDGAKTPPEIFKEVVYLDTPPQYWGDTTLWYVINSLAQTNPPHIKIEGPTSYLPQWKTTLNLNDFLISPYLEDCPEI